MKNILQLGAFLLPCLATMACSLTSTPPPPTEAPFPTLTNIPSTEFTPAKEIYLLPSAPCDILTFEEFEVIDDLNNLPQNIQEILKYPIANKGEPFNPTDVLDPASSVPGSRFVLAAIGLYHTWLVIERGGIAHYVEVSLYLNDTNGLQSQQTWSLSPSPYPNTLNDIKDAICKP